MKIHKKAASLNKKYYKEYFGSLDIAQAFIQRFLFSLSEGHYGPSKAPALAHGKLPKDWQAEWVRAEDVLRFHTDWKSRAYAIRAVEGDIAKFAHNFAWEQRTQLSVNTEFASTRFRTVWRALNSAAVGDWSFAKQVAEDSRALISGGTCYHIIAKAVFFLLAGDLKKAASVAKLKDKGSASYYLENQSIAFTRGLCSAIVAAFEKDPLRVAHGIKLALVNVRDRDECALQAQGLAAILRRMDPHLLSEFDGAPLDAWDNELWEWTKSNAVDFSTVDLKRLSFELHETLVELKRPEWFSYKDTPRKQMQLSKVAVPTGILQDYWSDLSQRNPGAIVDYQREQDRFDHFVKYRKLNKKAEPINAREWARGRKLEWIRNDMAQWKARNVDEAQWFEKPGKTKSQFWAINQFERWVVSFIDPARDKNLYEIQRFETAADASKYVKEKIRKQTSKGFAALRRQAMTEEKMAQARATQPEPAVLADPNQQAVAELWAAFGVPKLQAQKMARKAARDMEKDDTDSIIEEMNTKARRRQEWQKEKQREQKSINRQTAALERELKKAAKAKPSTGSSTSAAKKRSSSTKVSAGSKPAASATTKSALAKGSPSTSSKATTSSAKHARRFEFTSGSSNKFWTVRIDGSSVVTEWGKIGTAGQTTVKPLATPEKAQAEYDKLIREKTGKGYVEIRK